MYSFGTAIRNSPNRTNNELFDWWQTFRGRFIRKNKTPAKSTLRGPKTVVVCLVCLVCLQYSSASGVPTVVRLGCLVRRVCLVCLVCMVCLARLVCLGCMVCLVCLCVVYLVLVGLGSWSCSERSVCCGIGLGSHGLPGSILVLWNMLQQDAYSTE